MTGFDAHPPAVPARPAAPFVVRERRFGFGVVALLLKLGPKLLAVLAKLAKSVKLAKVGLAGASLGGYALLFSWEFAVIIVASIAFHEYGHVWAMRRQGMRTRGFYLLPFIGGAAVPDSKYPSEGALAYVSIMGPVFGFVLAVTTGVVALVSGSALLAAASSWMALINLFNLFPVNPLDGGRILRSVAYSIDSRLGKTFLVVSVLVAIAFALVTNFLIFAFLAFIGGIEVVFEMRRHRQMPTMSRGSLALVGACYALLVALLWALMHTMQHEPGAALALEALKG